MINLRELGKPGNASLAGLGVVGLLGGWIAGYAMHWGPLAYSDSVSYLEMAHNLLAGLGPIEFKGSGKIELLATHPPFYSIVLALFSLTGQPLIITARILNIVLFALFVFGVGLLLYLIMRRPLISLYVSFFLLSARVMVTNFTGAMSEPIFFCLGVFGLFFVLIYLRTKHSGFLWISAALTGLSIISRFTGVTIIAAGCAALLIFSLKPIKKRLWDALSYFILSLIPFLIWRIYLNSIGGYLGFYSIPAYPEMATLLSDGFKTMIKFVFRWLPWGSQIEARFPDQQTVILTVLGLCGLLFLLLALFKQGKNLFRAAWGKPNFQIGITFGVFNLVYFLFLMFTYVFVNFPKPFLDDRVLSPLLVGGVLSAVGFLDFILEDTRPAILRQIIPAGMILLFIIPNINPTMSYVQSMHIAGIGYTSKTWQRSGTIKAVMGLPADVHIISDNIDAIKFYTFRSASRIPELESMTPQPFEQTFGDNPDDPVQAQFRNGQAVLVLFNDAYSQFDAIYGGQATQTRLKAFTNGLYPYYEGSDGSIYYYSAPK